jgi:hypothetical protein
MGISYAPPPPEPIAYGYIDGTYLLKRYQDSMTSVFGTAPNIDFGKVRSSLRLKRLYFYDCEAGPNDVWQKQQQDALSECDFCFPRMGTLGRGFKKDRQQKEVDVLLAVDMLRSAYSGVLTEALLIAGDLDYRPVIEALVDRGVIVKLLYDPRSINKGLFNAVDVRRTIGLHDYHSWTVDDFASQHPLPTTDLVKQDQALPEFGTLRTGRIGDRRIRFKQFQGQIWLILEDSKQSQRFYFLEEQMRFFRDKYVPEVFEGQLEFDP